MRSDEVDSKRAPAMGALEQARTHFEAGDLRRARDAAMEGLGEQPDDVELLRVAGRAGVELGAEDAAAQLRRVAEHRSNEAEAWRDLGDALAAEGSTAEANEAFRKVLELEPGDEVALTALGHDAFASGRQDDAVSMLSQAAEGADGSTTAAISLVEMYKVLGKHEKALEAATAIAEADSEDLLAALDVAQLNLELGRHDEAVAGFEQLREVVEHPEQEVAALHGTIKVELARGDTARALELARQASALDTVGRTTGVLAHLEAEAGDAGGEELPRNASVALITALEAPPSRAEVDAALDATLTDAHRDWAEHDRRVRAADLG